MRREPITGKAFRVFYDDRNSARLVGEEQVVEAMVADSPSNSLIGAVSVEIWLTKMLGLNVRKWPLSVDGRGDEWAPWMAGRTADVSVAGLLFTRALRYFRS